MRLIYVAIIILILLIGAVSAKEQTQIPSEWKGYSKITEKDVNKNTDLVVTIHYADNKNNKQLIKNNITIKNSVIVQYGLGDTYKYYGDGQAYGIYGHWNITGGVNGTIKYWINPTGSGVDPTLTIEAVKNGMDKWDNNVIQSLIVKDWDPYNISVSPGFMDGNNVIGWENLNYPNAIAMSLSWINVSTKEILESDIIFNTEYPWGISPGECSSDNFMDIENIGIHEAGHFYGLLDITVMFDDSFSILTMYGYSTLGETKKRSPEFGDLMGIKELYEFYYIPPPPPIPESDGILKNPYFSNSSGPNINNWTFYTNGAGSFDAYVWAYTYIFGRVNITTPGTNNQLYQYDVKLEPNTNYTLSFDSYNPRTINQTFTVDLWKHTAPYVNYGLSQVFTVPAGEHKTFETTFKTTGFSSNVTDGRFRFYFDHANGGDSYQFKRVILKRA